MTRTKEIQLIRSGDVCECVCDVDDWAIVLFPGWIECSFHARSVAERRGRGGAGEWENISLQITWHLLTTCSSINFDFVSCEWAGRSFGWSIGRQLGMRNCAQSTWCTAVACTYAPHLYFNLFYPQNLIHENIFNFFFGGWVRVRVLFGRFIFIRSHLNSTKQCKMPQKFNAINWTEYIYGFALKMIIFAVRGGDCCWWCPSPCCVIRVTSALSSSPLLMSQFIFAHIELTGSQILSIYAVHVLVLKIFHFFFGLRTQRTQIELKTVKRPNARTLNHWIRVRKATEKRINKSRNSLLCTLWCTLNDHFETVEMRYERRYCIASGRVSEHKRQRTTNCTVNEWWRRNRSESR